MKFLCDDGKIYFCKFRSGKAINPSEIDFLAYEIVCHFLLKLIGVPTPDVALVELDGDSYLPRDLKANKKYAKPGVICFGSREIKDSNLITGLEIVKSESGFRKYFNPEDLVKIASFDLWIANVDRGRDENFNLLTHMHLNKVRIVAFDNAFAFHAANGLGVFNNNWEANSVSLARTDFFKSVTRFIPQKQRFQLSENVLNCTAESLKHAVNEAFDKMPPSWTLSIGLKQRILDFLLNKNRIATLKRELMLLLLDHKK